MYFDTLYLYCRNFLFLDDDITKYLSANYQQTLLELGYDLKTITLRAETFYLLFVAARNSVTVLPPIPQLSVSTSSMTTTVVAGFLV